MKAKRSSAGAKPTPLENLIGPEGARLTGLLDVLEDTSAWVKDRLGRYCWVSRAFLVNLALNRPGSSAEPPQVVGKTDRELWDLELAEQYRRDDDAVMSKGRELRRIELVQQIDGLASWNLTHKIPLWSRNGKMLGTAGLTRRLRDQDTEVALGPHFGRVLEQLRNHYQQNVTNEALARLAGLSVRAFERRFRSCFHVSPQQYLRKLRLRMASHALLRGGQTIVEVALSSGFSDQSHFTREFRRYFGQTPREYRESRAGAHAGPVTKTAARKQ